jgi:hypothetical protein
MSLKTQLFQSEEMDEAEEKIHILCKNPYNVNYVIFLQFKSHGALNHLTIKSVKKYISRHCTGQPDPADIDLIYMGKMLKNSMKLCALQAFNGKYMMHMLFKGKSEFAKSLPGFMEENNIHRSDNPEPKPRGSYHESQLRITSDDVAAKLDYAETDYTSYVNRYTELQKTYFHLHGVYFPALYYKFEDYMRESAETKSVSFARNLNQTINNRVAKESIKQQQNNPGGGENAEVAAAEEAPEAIAAVNPEAAAGANPVNQENEAEEENNNGFIAWVMYIMNIFSYIAIALNTISLIFEDEVPISIFIAIGLIAIILKCLKNYEFIYERHVLSYTELSVRFFMGLIASLSPEWKFTINEAPAEEEVVENREAEQVEQELNAALQVNDHEA